MGIEGALLAPLNPTPCCGSSAKAAPTLHPVLGGTYQRPALSIFGRRLSHRMGLSLPALYQRPLPQTCKGGAHFGCSKRDYTHY